MNFIKGALCGLVAGCGLVLTAEAQPVQVGAGQYLAAPKSGDKAVPAAPHRTEAMLKRAAQSNQWYSTLIYSSTPEAIFVQPLTVKPTAAGLEVALPTKEVVPTERKDTEIHFPHRHALVLSPVAFEPGPAKLASASDWAIDISMARGADEFSASVAHGVPYAFLRVSRGDLRVRLPGPGERFDGGADARVLALRVRGQAFALFGPTGVRWEQVSPTEWLARLPEGKGFMSVAGMPDDKPDTLALFAKHAYAFITDTRVDWRYDVKASAVETTFKATTKVMEGPDAGPLLGLYPHHWFENASVQGKLGPTFNTVRGPIRLLPAAQFSTRATYHGVVPYWPGVPESARTEQLRDVLAADVRNARRLLLESGYGKGPYWQGKGLMRLTKMADVAEQQGDIETRDRLLGMVKKRIEEWYSGQGRSYFHYDKAQGTVVAYPDEFFFVEQMNDHHFTWGYWIRAMADIAIRDPEWASKQKWGGMTDLLIADIATAERGRADFPFLRNFDPYEGHSWASGIGLGATGNNQESSSEAISAWAGLIMWGELTGNRELRDLGVYMYTTEVQAINHYWFDIHGQVFQPEYKNVEVSMLFGGKYAHNTWWTDEPRQIKGINMLPITTVSNYLGRDPKYVLRNMAALKEETAIYNSRFKQAKPPDIWQDIFAKYLALADPAAGLANWDRWGAIELGHTRTHTLHYLLSLQQMGPPDFSITADTPLYSVFKRADGKRTYLAFNATQAPIQVRFSDGKLLDVAPGKLASAN
jgi:endoglucanase Acf2